MKNDVRKERMMFFDVAIIGIIAVFISSFIFFGVSQAHAYAVGSVPPRSGIPSSNYNFNNSLQTLISPFTGFFNSLKWNNNTTINPQGSTSALPAVNITPVALNVVQNSLSQWLGQFDTWFYGLTNIRLSGISYMVLSAISWTLGLATSVVNWLLGLFH